MTIKQKISLSFFISLIVASFVFISINAYAQKISGIEGQRQTLNQIMSESISLNLLSEEILTNPSNDLIENWQTKKQKIDNLIESIKLTNYYSISMISQMKLDLSEAEKIIQSINNYNGNIEELKNITNINITKEYINQIFLRTELVIAASLEIDEYLSRQIVDATTSRGFISIAGMMILTLVIIGNFLLIMRSISRRLASIIQTTKEFSKGNFGITITDPNSHDEIGELVRAFNSMAGELQNIYQNLELKVRERTAKLAEEKANIEAIIKNMGDGLIVLDKNNLIIMANPVIQKLFNLNDNISGKKWPDILKKNILLEEHHDPITNLAEKISQDKYVKSEMKNKILALQMEGKIKKYLSETSSPVILDGIKLGTVYNYRDVSQERAVDRAKTEFVSLASHQLRTPLSTIRWYAEMLLGKPKLLSSDQRRKLNEIYQSNLRMIDLVNSLLNVSRLELGTFSVEPSKIDIVKTTKEIVREFVPQIRKKKLKISRSGLKQYEFAADPKLLKMVIQNIISNAVKYTPSHNIIKINIVKLDKGNSVDDILVKEDSILLQVSDSGVGIPENQQQQVFTKFFRADNVQTNDTKGTGLGLYIVKMIMDEVGGKIWFNSVEGQGTKFFLLFPTRGMDARQGAKQLE
jgi:signal transduction histidine kinase/HAMP domain-containing protein